MTNPSMVEQESAEPKSDIVGKFNERFKLPKFELLGDGVEYNENSSTPNIRTFSLAIEHERGIFTGQIGVGADLNPIFNPMGYRQISADGGAFTSYGGQRAVYAPFGSIGVSYTIAERGFEHAADINSRLTEGIRFYPPVILSVVINGFRLPVITRALSDARVICVLYANGRVFGGSEGSLDAKNIISGYSTWKEFNANGEYTLEGGVCYICLLATNLCKT